MIPLEARAVTVRFGGRRPLTAVDAVDLEVPAGGALGLVGESGSGKSTLARALVGLVPVASGQVFVDGADVTGSAGARRRELRRRVQMVFQDPYASLNPRMTVGDALGEAATAHRQLSRAQRTDEVNRLLEVVALESSYAGRLPRELSGGQRQRVAIARALAVRPAVLIADEITSALDASVQGAILNLLRDIRSQLRLTVLFISHNLAAVRYVCDTAAVMNMGRIVEVAPVDDLVTAPRHPYTAALLEAVPRLGGPRRQDNGLGDEEPPDPHARPSGCPFHTRCPVGPKVHEERTVCVTDDPQPGAADRPHAAACHFAVDGEEPPSLPTQVDATDRDLPPVAQRGPGNR
ncbi:MAG TPA: oligopeptide/dipeptide ABC transporter ATP-binding protein [Micromonosporaceae bacterium]|nr:oligopeptide/dipeptide ABC transporter ATP-binding protein [Micromonosporaceae bacterium]